MKNNHNNNNQFKAALRTSDVYVGRVDTEVTMEDIEKYIGDTFDLTLFDIEKLNIVSSQYNAFKITVKVNERDKLFKPECWPEGIIVNKYYNRSTKNSNKALAS